MKKRHLHILLILFLCTFALLTTLTVSQSQAAAKLTRKTLTLVKGQKKVLKMTGTKKRPTWSSKNPKIAKVKRNGKYSAKITARKKGTTYIYAKINKKTYRCKVTVLAPSSTDNAASTDTATSTDSAASKETASVNAGEYSIGKKHTGDGTYYDGGYTGGCCNLDAIAGDYYVAAINKIDYRAGNLAGAYLKVTGPNGSINVLITDTLADGEGKKGDIDLNKKAFAKIEPLVTGRMTVTWEIIPLPTNKPIQYVYKPTSTQYWMEVQVRNHRYPVKKLEIKNSSGKYVELERQEYNYFKMDNPGKGPYTFRVTDIYNHVLIDKNIALSPSKAVDGKANFPY